MIRIYMDLEKLSQAAARLFVELADQDTYQITLTAPFINQAAQVIFPLSGEGKAHPLQQVLEGSYQPHELPAQLIRPNGAQPIWLVDKAASHKLSGSLETAVEFD